MIDRRAFVQGAALALANVACLAGGRSHTAAALSTPPAPDLARVGLADAARPPRIGVLGDVDPVGWTVRTSLVDVECRWAGAHAASFRDLAGDLVARRVDVIVAIGATATRAAASVARETPIVFVAGADPDRGDRTVRFGNDATGLLVPSDAAIARQRLGLLTDVAPGLERVAVLTAGDNPAADGALAHLRSAATRLGIGLARIDASTAGDADAAIARLGRTSRSGLLVLPDALFAIHAKTLVRSATEARLPALYPARAFVDAGGLMALSGDAAGVVHRVASLVARVLSGDRASSIPVESVAPHALAVNRSAACALELFLPRSLLARADAVVT